MTLPFSAGLLGRQASGGGLLGDPIQQALLSLAQRKPQVVNPSGLAGIVQGSPLPQAGPPPVPSLPAPPAPQEAPPPAPPTRRPLLSPTSAALFAAGQELTFNGANSFPDALARALASGVPAFLQTKANQRAQEDVAASEADFQRSVDSLDLPPNVKNLVRKLGREEGLKFAAEFAKPQKVGRDERVIAGGQEVISAEKKPSRIEKGPDGQLFRISEDEQSAIPLTDPSRILPDSDVIAEAQLMGVDLTRTSINDLSEKERETLRNRLIERERLKRPPGTTVNVDLADKAGAKLQDFALTQLTEGVTRGREIEASLSNVSKALDLVDLGGFIGPLSPLKTRLTNTAEDLGFDVGNLSSEAARTEEVKALILGSVLPQLKAIFGARSSDIELAKLEERTGSVKNNREALRNILTDIQATTQREISRINRDFVETRNQLVEQGIELPASLRPAGVFTDPKHGEVFFVGDKLFNVPRGRDIIDISGVDAKALPKQFQRRRKEDQ